MLVRDRMTPNPTTIALDTSLKDALDLIRSQPFRHLPVVDGEGKLAGIVTEKTLVYASPSPELSLSVFEIDHLMRKIQVSQVMSGKAVTVSSDLPLEEAARVMVDHRIGCLPVVDEGELVGIISDTDIFRVFVEGMGGGHAGLRITVLVPEKVGSLARVVTCIADMGANIHTLGTFLGERPEDRIISFRVDGVDRDGLVAALQEQGVEVLHVWQAQGR
jgi:acetoin utilization protein AcuB